MEDKEFQEKIKRCFKPIDEIVKTLMDQKLGIQPKKQMTVFSSYAELRQMLDSYGQLEIIPKKPIDYHPYLKKGCLGTKDKLSRNYIFAIDSVDVDNCAFNCHVIGEYDFDKDERMGYRCGRSLSCQWYLNAGEKYFYNVNQYPDEKYIEFVFTKTVIASKDVDQIRDNGGKSEHKDLSHPGRDDKRNRYNVKEIKKEDRADYKDTAFDPDMKTGENKMESMNIRMAKELHKVAKMLLARDLGRTWGDEQKHVEMVQNGKFDSYLDDFMKYVNNAREQYYKKEFPNLKCEPLICNKSRNYVKIIVVQDGQQRSVWGFVNMANGDILKAAGWNAPAKHARGNIFDTNSWKGSFSPFGPNYLR